MKRHFALKMANPYNKRHAVPEPAKITPPHVDDYDLETNLSFIFDMLFLEPQPIFSMTGVEFFAGSRYYKVEGSVPITLKGPVDGVSYEEWLYGDLEQGIMPKGIPSCDDYYCHIVSSGEHQSVFPSFSKKSVSKTTDSASNGAMQIVPGEGDVAGPPHRNKISPQCLFKRSLVMPLESARQFVVAMREDRAFRCQVQAAANDESLTMLIRKNGFAFEWHHLVAAMAGCMEELEQGLRN